ncbi:MAG: histidinol phosphatase [Chloroflexi bacterium]|nr:histidinol phosphatase [Chloroflexota bacterium]
MPGTQHPDAELDAWLGVALDIADAADAISMGALHRQLEIHAKDDGSFVTEADQAIERHTRELLGQRLPTHGVLGEEYGEAPSTADVRWIVDPIDGTHNFMRGVPVFATLLAAERAGELLVGVVSAPALGRRWWARRGGGAWVTEPGAPEPRRVHVSDRSTIAEAQLIYRSILDMRSSPYATGFESLLTSVWRDRAFGDFWGYLLVAEGAAELMMERDLHVWDVAAPWVIVEEAGGRMTDLQGRRDWTSGDAFASNGVLHDPVLATLHADR